MKTERPKIDPKRRIPKWAIQNAVWLAEGVVRTAARLLKTTPTHMLKDLTADEACGIFCCRTADWMPEHSLRPYLDAECDVSVNPRKFSKQVELCYPMCIGYDVVAVGIQTKDRMHEILGTGDVDGCPVIIISTGKNDFEISFPKLSEWRVWSASISKYTVNVCLIRKEPTGLPGYAGVDTGSGSTEGTTHQKVK